MVVVTQRVKFSTARSTAICKLSLAGKRKQAAARCEISTSESSGNNFQQCRKETDRAPSSFWPRQINAVCAKITAAAGQPASEQRLIGNKNAQNQNSKRAGFKIPSVMTGWRECARNINDHRQSKSYCFSSPTQAQRAIKVIRCHKITDSVSGKIIFTINSINC